MELNEINKTNAWLSSHQVEHENKDYRVFNDHRFAIIASSHPHGLFAEVITGDKEYHYCNGELHIIYQKGKQIWRIK